MVKAAGRRDPPSTEDSQCGLENLVVVELAEPVELGTGVVAIVGMNELEQAIRRGELLDRMAEERGAVQDFARAVVAAKERDRVR